MTAEANASGQRPSSSAIDYVASTWERRPTPPSGQQGGPGLVRPEPQSVVESVSATIPLQNSENDAVRLLLLDIPEYRF